MRCICRTHNRFLLSLSPSFIEPFFLFWFTLGELWITSVDDKINSNVMRCLHVLCRRSFIKRQFFSFKKRFFSFSFTKRWFWLKADALKSFDTLECNEAIYDSFHFLVKTVKMQRNSSKGRGEERKERRRKAILSFLVRFLNLFLIVGAQSVLNKELQFCCDEVKFEIFSVFRENFVTEYFSKLLSYHHISLLPPVIENVKSFSIQLFIAKGYIYKVHGLWPHVR